MKIFFDTSAYVKKYIFEDGWEKLDGLLADTTAIVVAPVYLLEIRGVIQRKLRERLITPHQAYLIKQGVDHDYDYFEKILWDEPLEQSALALIEKYQLKTLDSIQLASAHFSKADMFVTSDQKLFQTAKKEIKSAVFI